MIEELEQVSDPVEDYNSHQEQIKLLVERGEIVGTALVADYYKKIVLDGKSYRTHAIFVDIMEDSD